jgi:hypothetical protein
MQVMRFGFARNGAARATLMLGILVLSSQTADAQNQSPTFYVLSQDGYAQPAYDRPESVQPDHWDIWYFRRGYSPSQYRNAPGRWGTTSRPTAAEVMEEQRRLLRGLQAWQRICRCDCDDRIYENMIGPIAVMRQGNQLIDKGMALGKSIAKLKELWDSAEIIVSANEIRDIPNQKDQSFIQDYILAMKDAAAKLNKLQKDLEGAITPAQSGIDAAINEINKDLSNAQQARDRISTGEGTTGGSILITLPDDITIEQHVTVGPVIRVDNIERKTTYERSRNNCLIATACDPYSRNCSSTPSCSPSSVPAIRTGTTTTERYSWEASAGQLEAEPPIETQGSTWSVPVRCGQQTGAHDCIMWKEAGTATTRSVARIAFKTREAAYSFYSQYPANKAQPAIHVLSDSHGPVTRESRPSVAISPYPTIASDSVRSEFDGVVSKSPYGNGGKSPYGN